MFEFPYRPANGLKTLTSKNTFWPIIQTLLAEMSNLASQDLFIYDILLRDTLTFFEERIMSGGILFFFVLFLRDKF